jgi:hypothetical protein
LDGLGLLRQDLSLKEAIVNAMLRLLIGYICMSDAPDYPYLGVGIRIACPNERGNARPGCGMSGVRAHTFLYIYKIIEYKTCLVWADLATNKTGL